MITLSMATACIGTGGNGVIVDEGTGWREGGSEGGREEGRKEARERGRKGGWDGVSE